MRDLKVLFITPEFDKRFCGGLGTVVNSVSLPIAARIKLDVMLLAIRKHGSWFRDLTLSSLYKTRKDKFRKIAVRMYKFSLWWIKNYDVVHFFHYSEEIVEIIQYIKKHALPIKMVFSCHYILKFEQNIRCIYKDLLKTEEFIFSNVDCIHLLTQASRDALASCYPEVVRTKPCYIIANGISAEKFPRQYPILEKFIKKEDTVVLTVSRWCHGKGLEYLMEAVPLVLKEEKDVKFIIGGRKANSWENKVWEYVEKVDRKVVLYKDNVFALGWVSKEQIFLLLKMSTLWVMPSELEYFPYSILEPMIYQVPIITARFPGYDEIITEEQECLAYEPKDSADLAQKIIRMVRDRKLQEKLRANAYSRASKEYNWDTVAEQYIKMYESII